MIGRPEDAIGRPQLFDEGGETLGELGADASGIVHEISDKFGHKELQKLYQLLNSTGFQAPLTNYNCGEAVPKMVFSVWLRPKSFATTRALEIYFSPELSPAGHTRCLLFGVYYLLDKAVAGIDPDPQQDSTREPHCDCTNRDSNVEWVTHPGPDEILAPVRVAAKIAARKADEAKAEKEGSLAIIHLDRAGVQVEPNDASEHLVTRETSLGRPPSMEMLTVDPGFSHWVCVVKRDGKQLVVLDGVEGKLYDEIPYHQGLEFSKDGSHFAYVAKLNGKMMVVADGREGKAYNSIHDFFHSVFSPDGKRLAYIASRPAFGFAWPKSFAVVDGQEQKDYETVEGILFSPDSRHLEYCAEKSWNRGMFVVEDGKEGKTYDQISQEVFSPDSSRFAYVAYNRTNRDPEAMGFDHLVADGKEGKAYDSISFIRFSPDSKHLAHVAGIGSNGAKVLGRDEVEKRYLDLVCGPFSPDSQHLACVARFGTNWLVLIDGKKLNPQEQPAPKDISLCPVSDLEFSPNSRHLAYISRGSETNWAVALDGTVLKIYEGIAVSPIFSPNSRRLAYATKRGGKSIPVFGGYEGKNYDQILGFVFDEKGVLHAMAIRYGEVFRVEMELVNN